MLRASAVGCVLQLYFLHLDRRALVIIHDHIDGGADKIELQMQAEQLIGVNQCAACA